MKKRTIGLLAFIMASTMLFSQKYAYVDTEYVLDNIPEYKDAQLQLDELAEEYQAEIEEKYAEIEKMYANYQAEAVLLPDDIRDRREKEIRDMELQVKELQQKRFGVDGDLFDKREELIRPMQEKVFNAIEEIAVEKNYAFVFDKAGSLTILYSNDKFDISDDVLDKVGAELGTVRKEDRVRKEYKGGSTTNSGNKSSNNKNQARPSPPGMNSPGTVNKSERK